MNKVEVNAKGIKNRLKSVKPQKSIAEYIWNGFDAGANSIDIVYETNHKPKKPKRTLTLKNN